MSQRPGKPGGFDGGLRACDAARMMSVFRERILAGKNAYITGGTSGICLGIAELFARQGASVAVQGRNPEKVQAAVQMLAGHGGLVRGCPADGDFGDRLRNSEIQRASCFGVS